MKTALTLAAALAATAALSASASAVVVTTAAGPLGADNQVNGFGAGRADVNKGGAASFDVRGNTASQNSFYGVLRFDLSSVDTSAGVDAATLSVTLAADNAAGGSVGVFGLPDGFAGGPDSRDNAELGELTYTEGTRNFAVSPDASDLDGDNAPGFNENNSLLAALTAAQTALGTITVPAGATAGTAFTLSSPALSSFLAADTNDAAVIYLGAANTSTFLSFRTKEGATAPSLDVTPTPTTVIPEPTAAAMVGVAGLSLLRRRR